MQTNAPPDCDSAADLARECLYRFLSLALTDPHADGGLPLLRPEDQQLALQSTDLLRAEVVQSPLPLAFAELSPEKLDLRPLLAELRQPFDHLRAQYDRVFGLVLPRECPPYETEYHPTAEPFFRSQQLADVAGFYRAFGLEPSRSVPEREDFLTLELEFMAFLLMKKRLAMAAAPDHPDAADQAAVCDDASRKFFADHLAWWVPAFAAGLRRKAGDGFYAALADVLAALIPAERNRLGVSPPANPVGPELIERPEEQSGCAACGLSG